MMSSPDELRRLLRKDGVSIGDDDPLMVEFVFTSPSTDEEYRFPITMDYRG